MQPVAKTLSVAKNTLACSGREVASGDPKLMHATSLCFFATGQKPFGLISSKRPERLQKALTVAKNTRPPEGKILDIRGNKLMLAYPKVFFATGCKKKTDSYA